jgi:hypothetical protein
MGLEFFGVCSTRRDSNWDYSLRIAIGTGVTVGKTSSS